MCERESSRNDQWYFLLHISLWSFCLIGMHPHVTFLTLYCRPNTTLLTVFSSNCRKEARTRYEKLNIKKIFSYVFPGVFAPVYSFHTFFWQDDRKVLSHISFGANCLFPLIATCPEELSLLSTSNCSTFPELMRQWFLFLLCAVKPWLLPHIISFI